MDRKLAGKIERDTWRLKTNDVGAKSRLGKAQVKKSLLFILVAGHHELVHET